MIITKYFSVLDNISSYSASLFDRLIPPGLRERATVAPRKTKVRYLSSNSYSTANGRSSSVINLEFSLISTFLNEAEHLSGFLDSVQVQTKHPAEVIFCDGGSVDDSVAIINEWIALNAPSFKVLVFSLHGANIATGRNEAAKRSLSSILLFTDVGATLSQRWCERMLAPFEECAENGGGYDSPGVAVIGWYEAVIKTVFQKHLAYYLLPKLENLDPETLLPSGRSLGVSKNLYFELGGFPENLSFAGEDSLFGDTLRGKSSDLYFVPEAKVYWDMPGTVLGAWKKIFYYAVGDGESGFLFWGHYLKLLRMVFTLAVSITISTLFFVVFSFVFSTAGIWSCLLFLFCLVFPVRVLLNYVLEYPASGEGVRSRCMDALAILVMASAQTLGFFLGASRCLSTDKLRRIFRERQ